MRNMPGMPDQPTDSKVLASAKRRPPNAGKGRVKGVPNKVTGQLKDMILKALDEAGGVNYLVAQADENPTAFLTLVGKVLPLQVNADVEGRMTVTGALQWQPPS